MQSAARTKTAEWLQNRDGFSEYKNFERELISYCRVQIYCWTYYNMSMYKWKSGKFAYKTGFSFTKWEIRLQNEIFIYKEGLLRYKRDSHSTFHHGIYHHITKMRFKQSNLLKIIIQFRNIAFKITRNTSWQDKPKVQMPL